MQANWIQSKTELKSTCMTMCIVVKYKDALDFYAHKDGLILGLKI